MIKIFFSYSHRNEAMRDELEVHLAMLKRQGIIETWHDRRIGAGRDFAGVISDQLESCDIVLLLVSPYFLASDYCYDVEMMRAMECHHDGSARVIPVVLDPCDWHEAPFGALLAAPTDGKPISKFANIHDGFLEVTKAIRQAARDLGREDPRSADKKKEKPRAITSEGARSSNLRVARDFTDSDKDHFLDESFEYISNFFENSLGELARRNPQITTRFKRLSDARFTAFVYRNGESVSECCIRQGNMLGNSITYSMSAADDGGYNESLSVDHDEHALFLRPMGMAMMGGDRKQVLSQQGAAEYLWSILMQPLQRSRD